MNNLNIGKRFPVNTMIVLLGIITTSISYATPPQRQIDAPRTRVAPGTLAKVGGPPPISTSSGSNGRFPIVATGTPMRQASASPPSQATRAINANVTGTPANRTNPVNSAVSTKTPGAASALGNATSSAVAASVQGAGVPATAISPANMAAAASAAPATTAAAPTSTHPARTVASGTALIAKSVAKNRAAAKEKKQRENNSTTASSSVPAPTQPSGG